MGSEFSLIVVFLKTNSKAFLKGEKRIYGKYGCGLVLRGSVYSKCIIEEGEPGNPIISEHFKFLSSRFLNDEGRQDVGSLVSSKFM